MEENKQKTIHKQILFGFIGVAILLIGIVGVTYAFFNYTRTGAANTIRTGKIEFASEQGEEVTLSDLFPISATGTITPQTPGVGSVTVHVSGDTDYSGGIEYVVKSVNVTGSNGTNLPISVNISYEANGAGKTIGTPDANYFTTRGGNSSVYKVLTTDTITEGGDLVVGYIAPGATGIDGNIVVMAYLDANNIAITDTNPEKTYYGYNENMTAAELTACASNTALATGYETGETAAEFCAGTGTRGGKTLQEHLDEDLFSSSDITALLAGNVISELYTDGTTDAWVDGRTVFTTEEWNSLQSSGVSFQIKVEANEGVWVPGTISGAGTVTGTSASAGTISVTQGNVSYSVGIEMVNNQVQIANSSLSFTNSSTNEDLTSSDLYDKVEFTLQNSNCNNGEAVTVVNHASGDYTDGVEALDPTFAQCLITNNQ